MHPVKCEENQIIMIKVNISAHMCDFSSKYMCFWSNFWSFGVLIGTTIENRVIPHSLIKNIVIYIKKINILNKNEHFGWKSVIFHRNIGFLRSQLIFSSVEW